MTPSDLAGLIQAFRQNNDQDAFHRLFELNQQQVWSYIHARGIPQADAPDIFQEVALHLAQYLKDRDPDNLQALVMTIARNKIADYFRKSKPDERDVLSFDAALMAPTDTESELETQWEVQRLLHGTRLTKDQRDALRLRYLIGFSIKEMAAILGEPEETIRGRIYLGKKKIRDYLDRKEHS